MKSNEIVIPNGKITDVKMFIDEENNLVLEIISQRDYSGSKEEAADIEKVRRGKLTKRIIIGIVIALSFALVCSIIMAFDSSIHYKSLAEDCILNDVQGLCGEDFELKNVTYTSTETQYFTNLEEYGLIDYLLKHRYIGENGTEYSDGIEYFESRGVDVYNSTKRASILKGTYEVSDGSVSLIGDVDIVIIELGNVSFTTLCYIEGVTVSETDAMTLAKNHLLTKINFSTLNDIELYFVDCTFSTTEVIGTNNYKFYGKVTAKDPYGNLYTANYEATVNRGDLYNQCEVDIDLGGFSKQ